MIQLLRDLCTRYLETKAYAVDVLDTPAALYNYLRARLGAFTEEVLLLIYLDVKHKIINTNMIGRGTIDTIIMHPKMIAEDALRNKAASVILVHNHPSGVTDPSPEDIAFTQQVIKVLRSLEIKLLDHLIVSRVSIYSLRNHNRMEERL